MSKTLGNVLAQLRELGVSKLRELDKQCEEHQAWLTLAVAEVKQQIASLHPTAKKQRLAAGGAKVTAVAEQEAQEHLNPRRRAARRGKAALNPVPEEAEEAETRVSDPSAPSAPVVNATQEAKKPATRGTKTRRGKQQQQLQEAQQANQEDSQPEPTAEPASHGHFNQAVAMEVAPANTRPAGRSASRKKPQADATAAEEGAPSKPGPARATRSTRRNALPAETPEADGAASLTVALPAAAAPMAAAVVAVDEQTEEPASIAASPVAVSQQGEQPAQPADKGRGKQAKAAEEPTAALAPKGRTTRAQAGKKRKSAADQEAAAQGDGEKPAPPHTRAQPASQQPKTRPTAAAAGATAPGEQEPAAPDPALHADAAMEVAAAAGEALATGEDGDTIDAQQVVQQVAAAAEEEIGVGLPVASPTAARSAGDEEKEADTAEQALAIAGHRLLAGAEQQEQLTALEQQAGAEAIQAAAELAAMDEEPAACFFAAPAEQEVALAEAEPAEELSRQDAEAADGAAASPPAAAARDVQAEAKEEQHVAEAQASMRGSGEHEEQHVQQKLRGPSDGADDGYQSAASGLGDACEGDEADAGFDRTEVSGATDLAAGRECTTAGEGAGRPSQALEDIADADSQGAHELASAPDGNGPLAAKGMTANLVSTIRSFLPIGKPAPPAPAAGTKKPAQKVKALEAAEAARRREGERAAERAKQKAENERARIQRNKAKQEEEARRQAEETRKREEARAKREAEATQRRREREEAERREREDKLRRIEELKAKRREEAAAAAATDKAAAPAPKLAASRVVEAAKAAATENQAANVPSTLAEAKQRLQKLQQHAIQNAQGSSCESHVQDALQGSASAAPATSGRPALEPKLLSIAGKPAAAANQQGCAGSGAATSPLPAAAKGSQTGVGAKPGHAARGGSAAPTALPAPSADAGGARTSQMASQEPAGPQTYEISPYKSDFESDDEEPKKPVPEWARGKALMQQLAAQMYVDPDEVFQQHQKTCSLDEVFASHDKKGKQDFSRRTSSGNWIEDRVTWKEELSYKKAMGYL